MSAAEAAGLVQSGMRVFIHGASATPTPLLDALAARSDLENVRLYHLHTAGPAPYVICGGPYSPKRDASVVYLNGRRLVGPVGRYGGAPKFVGHWRSVERSPDGRTLLLQWSAECEVPVAYLAQADGSRLRRVSRDPAANTVALGWTTSGAAVVAFPHGACGSAPLTPGTYRVDPRTRRATLVFRGLGALWG